jgi:hypothetical protein
MNAPIVSAEATVLGSRAELGGRHATTVRAVRLHDDPHHVVLAVRLDRAGGGAPRMGTPVTLRVPIGEVGALVEALTTVHRQLPRR